jgi:hypothetical protein
MSAHTFVVVYNGTQNGIAIDEEGHSVDPQSWACARRSFVREHIDADRLIVVDPDTIGEGSALAARLAKEAMEKANGEIDAQKAESEKAAPVQAKASKNTDTKTPKQ